MSVTNFFQSVTYSTSLCENRALRDKDILFATGNIP